MIQTQILGRGIADPLILNAMSKIPRDVFVPPQYRKMAYYDGPLPIGQDQTISQPYIVALMINGLGPENMQGTVLEIGTGSGYGAAVLSQIAKKVFTVERHKELADSARLKLRMLNIDNVEVIHGDGSVGLPSKSPFEGILITAAAPRIPEPLLQQLKIGGRMVIPVGESFIWQDLRQITKVRSSEFAENNLGKVAFVPLVTAR